MSKPKTDPARPVSSEIAKDGYVMMRGHSGLTQYAEIAARFHATCIPVYPGDLRTCATEAFNHADAFFAELAKRTQS